MSMTHDEMIAVIQAHKEGKKVQVRFSDQWMDLPNPTWQFNQLTYRVKPEPKVPREFWVELVTCFTSHNGATTQAATVHFYHPPQPGVIHVREVLEDQP